MAFLDDLEARAMQSIDTQSSTVQDWLESAVPDAVIKVGNTALGNQTAAQIAAGQPGGPKPLAAASNNPASKNASPYPTLPIVGAVSVPVLIAIGVGIYFLMKRR